MINDTEEFDDDFDLSNVNLISFKNTGYQNFSNLINQGKLYKGETIRGLTHVLPFAEMKFNNRATWQIENYYFPDAFKLKDKNTSIAVDVGSLNIEQDKFVVNNYFLDVNGNKVLDNNEFPYSIKMFVSKDGNKVKETYEVTKVAANEIVLFIEDQTGDYLSEQVIYGKIDAGLRGKFLELSEKYNLNFDQSSQDLKKYVEISNNVIEELVKNGKIEAKKTIPHYLIYGFKYTLFISTLIPFALGEIIDRIGNGIGYLKIPDTIWDTQGENYVFDKQNLIKNFKISTTILDEIKSEILQKKSNSILNLLPEKIEQHILLLLDIFKQRIEDFNAYITNKIDTFFDSDAYEKGKNTIDALKLQEIFAFYTGIYNGLIDFIASTISFIGDVLKLPKAIIDHFDEVLETIDNIVDFCRNFDWEKITTAFSKIYDSIIKYLKNGTNEDLDYVRIAYACGFAIAFVATMFIPYANIARVLSSIGKIGKFGALLTDLLSGFSKGTKTLAQAGKEGIRQMLKYVNELLALFVKGGKQLEAFFEKIVKDIGEWFLRNKKTFGLKDKTPASVNNLIKNYGKEFVKVGSSKVLRNYKNEFAKVIKQANSNAQKNIFKNDFKLKKTKLGKDEYIKVRIQQYINFEKGAKFEALFVKIYGGLKPADALVTSITKRFLDVLKRTTMYELKAGFITVPKNAFTKKPSQLTGFAKQVYKDMEILRVSDKINKLEYHIIEGISDDAVKFIYSLAKKQGDLANVKIILYK